MITYEQIQQHLKDGLKVEQIVELYSANMATVSDIDAGRLQSELAYRQQLYRDRNGAWVGSLVDAVEQSGVRELDVGLTMLCNQLDKPDRKVVETTRPEFGGLMFAMLALVDEVTAALILELSGGRKYFDVTAEAINEVIAEGEQSEQQARLEQQWTTLQNDGGINVAVGAGDRAGLVAALRSAADGLEAG